MFKTIKSGLLVFASLVLSTGAFAQDDNISELYKEVQTARTKGVNFSSYELFDIISGEKHDVLKKETLLKPRKSAISQLYFYHPSAVSVKVKNAEGTIYTLNMLRSNPLAIDGKIGYLDNNGEHVAPGDNGVHYQGAIDGYGQSLATLSVYEHGQVMMMFANKDGNYVVGEIEDKSGNYVLYNDKDFTVTPNSICGASDETAVSEPMEGNTGKVTEEYECNKISLYWETDYGLYLNKSSALLFLRAYVISLFNNVQAMYRNEKIAVELKGLNMWTVADGYAEGTTSSTALNDFRSKWNAKGNAFDGDLAMLLALDPGGLGGVAYVNQLCNKGVAYAYSDVDGSVNSIPTYSWDVMMVTHEIGHNIASPHTHACSWNTGVGGSCGSIDNCVTQERSGNCTTCPSTFDNSAPVSAWQGTVMSYCHIASRGVNLSNGFGPLPNALMRNTIRSKSCLKSIISAELVSTEICKKQGMVSVQFDSTDVGSNNFGAKTLTYTWSNGNNAKEITVTTAGTYTVTVTDSNGCTNSFVANVTESSADSCNGSATGIAEVQKEYVSIYPNPADDKVMLKFFSNSSNDMTVRMVDVMGRTVKTEALKAVKGENNLSLNVADITAGLYYISISSANQQFISLKLMVQ